MARSGSAEPGPRRLSAEERRGAGDPTGASSRPGADAVPRLRGLDTNTQPAGPSLTVAAVARRLGVAPATLRTWDRRYGLGPSEHLAGSHRRYSAVDVSRLLVMRRLTLEGVAPAEAARTALAAPADAGASTGGRHVPSVTEVVDAYSEAVPMAPDPAALVAAAGHFDNAAVRWMLSRVHPRDPLAWWTDLVDPALRTLTGRVTLEGPGEHAAPALTAAAFAELRSRGAVSAGRAEVAGAERRPAPNVLLLSVGRGADLLVHVVATALQEKGVPSRVLSSATARGAVEAVARVRPDAVLVQVGADDDDASRVVEVVRSVVEADDALPVFVHREGAARLDLPVVGSVHRVRTLTGTLHEVLAVVT